MQVGGELALGDVVAGERRRVGVEDRQRDVLELEPQVGVTVERKRLQLALDGHRRELVELAREADLGARVESARCAGDRAAQLLHVGREVRLHEEVGEVHASAIHANLADADRERVGGRGLLHGRRRRAVLACLGGGLLCSGPLLPEPAAFGRRTGRLGRGFGAPLGQGLRRARRVEHRGDVDHLFRADDDARVGLAHQHAVDGQRVRTHGVAELRQLEPLEADEILLERVVDGAEAVDRHVAREGQLGSAAPGRGERRLARDIEFTARDRQVGDGQHVRLQDLHACLRELDVELGGERLRGQRATRIEARVSVDDGVELHGQRSRHIQADV